jgi:hypothetical protein
MESNFNIVSSLCRQVVKDGASPAVLMQMERLRDAIKEQGSSRDAASMTRLINKSKNLSELGATNIQLSKQPILTGLPLSKSAKLPVDKESSAPLAEIITCEELIELEMPIFSKDLSSIVNNMVLEWEHADKLRQVGVPPAMSTMLFGEPGTGKTMLAHYLAKMLNLPIVVAKLDGLVSSFLGTSARNISNLFDFASRYQCILLLDEFDAVGKSRDDQREVGEIKRVVNTLLQCLDSRANTGITIAITNHEQLLDLAIWRRFDARIEVPRPNKEVRIHILKKHLGLMKLMDEEIHLLAWISDGMTGADIVTLTNSIKRRRVLNNKLSFIECLKSFSLISAHHRESRLTNFSEQSEQDLAKSFKENNVFNPAELSRLFKKDKRTITKWTAV